MQRLGCSESCIRHSSICPPQPDPSQALSLGHESGGRGHTRRCPFPTAIQQPAAPRGRRSRRAWRGLSGGASRGTGRPSATERSRRTCACALACGRRGKKERQREVAPGVWVDGAWLCERCVGFGPAGPPARRPAGPPARHSPSGPSALAPGSPQAALAFSSCTPFAEAAGGATLQAYSQGRGATGHSRKPRTLMTAWRASLTPG